MDFLLDKYDIPDGLTETKGKRISADYCLDVIFTMVAKSFSDVSTFKNSGQDDLIEMLDGHLNDFISVVGYLRDSLKDIELHMKVEELKKARRLEK